MSTSAVTSSTSTSSTTSTSSSSSTTSSIDFDSFIQLLATELKYQDPTDPVDTSEYMSQMIGIGSLEALENIYSATNNSSAYSLIGKDVTYEYTDSSGNTATASGTVDSVTISGSNTYLTIDGTTVSLDDIVQVANSSSTDSSSSSTTTA